MKSSPFTVAKFLTFAATFLWSLTNLAALEVKLLTGDRLLPKSVVVVNLDAPFPGAVTGEVAAVPPLVITPALPGQFIWTSERSAEFRVTGQPEFATSYQFKAAPGVVDEKGKSLAEQTLTQIQTDPMQFVLGSTYSDFDSEIPLRMRPAFVQSDVSLDPEGKDFTYVFVSKEKAQVMGQLKKAGAEDFKNRHYSGEDIRLTWKELAEGKTSVTLKTDPDRPNALIIAPASPLPVGKDWNLEIYDRDPAKTDLTRRVAKLSIGDIDPLRVREVTTETPYDRPRRIRLSFNNWPHDRYKAVDLLAPLIQVEPVPADLKLELEGTDVVISGAFELQTVYRVKVAAGLVARDELITEAESIHDVEFEPNAPYLATPVFDDQILSTGQRKLRFAAANVTQVKLRVKQLTDEDYGQAAAQYRKFFRKYQENQGEEVMKVPGVDWDKLPGKEVLNKVYPVKKPLDQSENIELSWDEVAGAGQGGLFYVDVQAVADPAAANPLILLEEQKAREKAIAEGVQLKSSLDLIMKNARAAAKKSLGPAPVIGTQAMVQISDLGLVVKSASDRLFVHAFSLLDGKAQAEVRLMARDRAGKVLGEATTGADGVASLPVAIGASVVATKGGQIAAVSLGDERSEVELYQFDINAGYQDTTRPRRRCYLFSDRPVYKPGEVLHLKGYLRHQFGDVLKAPPAPEKALLRVQNSLGRDVMSREFTVAKGGSFHEDIDLPEDNLGAYTVYVDFGPQAEQGIAGGQTEEEEAEDEPVAGANEEVKEPADAFVPDSNSAILSVRVEEYRPNIFEAKVAQSGYDAANEEATFQLAANYYMGKPLTQAKIRWTSRLVGKDFYAADFPYFTFGNSYWRNQEGEWLYPGDRSSEDNFQSGESSLDPKGTASLVVAVAPSENESSIGLREVQFEAEVTDINQQTITTRQSLVLPSAAFVVGVKDSGWPMRVNAPVTLDLLSLTPEGKPFASNAEVEVKIEQEVWNTVKVQAAGNATTMETHYTLVMKHMERVIIPPANAGAPGKKTLAYTPAEPGVHLVTITGKDARGGKTVTRTALYVSGGNTFAWQVEDGAKIQIVPDRAGYKPGETARILVQSPVSGSALVTVERNAVRRHFFANISPESPYIEVPIEAGDAPQVYVSATVVRGSQNSPKKIAMPEYRMGFCELKVDAKPNLLQVKVAASAEFYQPGEEASIVATVADAENKPLVDSEVTVYAVDEGILSLTGYITPDPHASFFSPDEWPLGVATHLSLKRLLPEDQAEQLLGNKAAIIGGRPGEKSPEEALSAPQDLERLRKNFAPCAYWGIHRTGEDGKVTVKFKAPDSLTRYRLIAVATGAESDGMKFGSAESALIIRKPLMLEPAVPRFANVTDQLQVKAVLHNDTGSAGEFSVRLELDDKASFAEAQPRAAALPLDNQAVNSQTKTIALKSGETSQVVFPLNFQQLGDTTLKWLVKSVKLEQGNKEYADATISQFNVRYPIPELRHVRYLRLDKEANVEDILKDVPAELRGGQGKITLKISRSRLLEADDALDHLLHYPYGCVEQTTSSLLPWLALKDLAGDLPKLNRKPEEIARIIQKGVNRILSMQTDEGGLAYWPGGSKAEVWTSAYGGLGLILGEKAGAKLPAGTMENLRNYLKGQMANLDQVVEEEALTDRALALYTLAHMGDKDAGYYELMHRIRARVPKEARMLVALAIAQSGAVNKTLIQAQLNTRQLDPKKIDAALPPSHWMGSHFQLASGALLQTLLDPNSPEAEKSMADLMAARRELGHWGTTVNNCWALLALAQDAKARQTVEVNVKGELTRSGDTKNLDLSRDKTQAELVIPLAAEPLALKIQGNQAVFAKVEVRSLPAVAPMVPREHGLKIERNYEKVLATGKTVPLDQLEVGDLVKVNLKLTFPDNTSRYVVVDDALPAIFEAVNSAFVTQDGTRVAANESPEWKTDHREIHPDRVTFFQSAYVQPGNYSLTYLARVISEGEVTAPSAKIEAMYDPNRHGLSNTIRLHCVTPKGEEGKPKKVVGN